MGTKWDFQSAAQSALALILLALGLMVWDQERPVPRFRLYETNSNVFSAETVDSINKHLQWTEKHTELNSLATDIENQETATSPVKGLPRKGLTGPTNPFETEDRPAQVMRDLEPESGKFDNPHLPGERISSIIEQRQWLENYNKKQTEEFVRAVRQNAREAGYQLEINDQLKITNVRRLPNSAVSGNPSGSR